MKKWVCVGGFLCAFGLRVVAQVSGDYQSVGNVDLNSATNWEYWNGNGWETATLPPDGNLVSPNKVTILAGHEWSNASSSLIPVGVTLVNKGTTGTFTTSAANKVVINGTYVHNTSSSISTIMLGMTINSGSLFIYRGNSSLTPAVSFSNRTYYDLKIESTSGNLSLNLAGFAGGTNPFTVNGNFTIGENVTLNQNTFTGAINLNGDVAISGTLNIYGFSIASGKTLSVYNNGVVNIPASQTVTINGIADAGTGKFSGDGSLIINGLLKSAHANGISATGNCQQTGGLSFGPVGEVEFNGNVQVITTASLANLKINSTGIISLGSDIVVNGDLVMNSGKLRLESFDLTVSGSAIGSSSSYIQTNSTGSFILKNITTTSAVPVGNSTYNPLQLSNGDGLDWSFRVSDSIEPSAGYTNLSKSVLRTWHISPSGTSSGADIVYQYDDSDPLQKGSSFLTSQDVQVWQHHNGNWSATSLALSPTGPASGGIRTITLNDQEEFSGFAIANLNTVLPVTLHSFTAVADNSLVKLSFVNDTEAGIEKYFIERVVNGIFNVVAEISPKKNDGSAVKYQYSDHPPHHRRHTYRVRALETIGNMIYSNVLWVDPKPVDDIILVTDRNEYFWKAKLPQGNYLLRIYNISGSLIKAQKFEHKMGEASGSFRLMQPGMYILVIEGNEKYQSMFSNY
jgi:hypothetical protein